MGRAKNDKVVGEFGYNNDGERMTIIRYGEYADIDVQFDDGTVIEHKRYSHFEAGSIKNPMSPTVYGVGFIGIGKFKSRDENGKKTKCYMTWLNMLMRCYDSKWQEKHPSYRGCTVSKEWLNFQNFAEWYYKHYYEFGNNQRMELDKDILCKGNKIYSPKTCVFVPQSINVLFVKSNNKRGEYPIGVTKFGNRFKAHLTKDNERIHLGTYTNPMEAFQAYKIAKEKYIKDVAEEYKDKIPCKLYQAMMNYKVEIDD